MVKKKRYIGQVVNKTKREMYMNLRDYKDLPLWELKNRRQGRVLKIKFGIISVGPELNRQSTDVKKIDGVK